MIRIPGDWGEGKFESYRCAFECDPFLDEVLSKRVGLQLDLKKPQSGFDLFSECEGYLHLRETIEPTQRVLDELANTVSPNQLFTVQNTGLPEPTTKTAHAICNVNGVESGTFRVVSLTEKTMLVYFEGASFLKFRAVQRQ